MGSFKVSKLTDKKDKANYIFQLIKDIEALDIMIAEGMIESEPIRIGAEQEFCLVDSNYNVFPKALKILDELNDPLFTHEIGNYNLEINLLPKLLKDKCFSEMHMELRRLLNKAIKVAEGYDAKVLLTGILPTLSLKDLSVEQMTPIKRYYALNEAIKESRGEDFDIHIHGVDEVNLLHDSVMLEGCNTSFQMHLQIAPDEFIEKYNWAQAISGPVLSACCNSPLLFGKELWSETRIALFTQSVDTRANSFMLNERQSRVSFGNNWETGSIANIYRDNISRFRSLLTSEFTKNSVEMLKHDEIPNLKALSLHNGTVYRWNRACYGIGNGKPHVRIENRYIGAGPSTIDEIANFVFWAGLMCGQSKAYKDIHTKMNFKDVKSNFFSAARNGLATQFIWNGELVSSQQLILDELLPMAYRGLYSMGVSPDDAERYLTVIERRVKSKDGARWMVRSYRNLLSNRKRCDALQVLTEKIHEKQSHDYPVSTWSVLNSAEKSKIESPKRVRHVMSTDIFSVDAKDSIELVLNIMKWKNIHHMPVIDDNKALIGLISWSDLEGIDKDPEKLQSAVKTFMVDRVISTHQFTTLEEAKRLMTKHKINCLPVVKDDLLIGIVTSNDIQNL